jgi:hypothetical protein
LASAGKGTGSAFGAGVGVGAGFCVVGAGVGVGVGFCVVAGGGVVGGGVVCAIALPATSTALTAKIVVTRIMGFSTFIAFRTLRQVPRPTCGHESLSEQTPVPPGRTGNRA